MTARNEEDFWDGVRVGMGLGVLLFACLLGMIVEWGGVV